MRETSLDRIAGQSTYTLFTSERAMINKISKLMDENPESVELLAKNEDGSILCHIPKEWVKIQPPRRLSDEQRANARERMIALRKSLESRE